MATQVSTKQKANPVPIALAGVLVVLIIIAIVYANSQKAAATDPTLTAAPPIVPAPGQTLHPLMASPAVMAIKQQEAAAQEAGALARKQGK